MTFYAFGMALSIALTVAIGNSWVRDNRGGVWTTKIVTTFAVVTILFGLLVGWSINEWLAWTAATAGQHSYAP